MRLTEDFKYKSIRATAGILAELMDATIPCLKDTDASGEKRTNSEVVVVPLPTISRHIRERGFDHTWLLAKKLAKRRNFGVERILERRNKTVQVGANEERRREQAKKAYGIAEKYLKGTWGCSSSGLSNEAKLDTKKTYLLIDDVWTTGASMEAAISVLREAGARKIIAAVILMPKR